MAYVVKVEFLSNGNDGSPLIRTYAFDRADVLWLLTAFSSLALGEREWVDLHELPDVEALDGIELSLHVGLRDRGIVKHSNARFTCVLTQGTWDNVAGLAEPFLNKSAGYQWLVTKGDVEWLLSLDGSW